MNQAVDENDFRRGLEKLLRDIAAEMALDITGPYEEGSQQLLLEHGTRILFFDRFLTLLGWSLGLGGNVAEEARIKAETTRFLDYVGLNDQSRAPVLIIEAKAWDKPFVRPRMGEMRATEKQLVVEAIKHLNAKGAKGESPVVGEWHEYLEQVAGYVRTSAEDYNHNVACAVLASGRWIVIFTSPVNTFVDGDVNEEHFEIFRDGQILEKAEKIHRLLNRRRLGGIAPHHIRPTQIRHYLSAETTAAVYHAVLVSYASTGAKFFTQIPQIRIYPALLLQRDDGTLLTVLDGNTSFRMDLDGADENELQLLTSHLTAVSGQAAALLEACSAELGMALQPFAMTDFPGFQDELARSALGATGTAKSYVRPINGTADEWIIVTGEAPHYLVNLPVVECRFHAWGECRVVGQQIGTAAVSTPSTDTPRAFFVDGQRYHCAHQTIVDRRAKLCHIAPLDMRTCCNACVLRSICWSAADLAQLPCGR
jgi:hypothetical protein